MTTRYKIGIFGDSYSTDFSLSFDQNIDTTKAGTAWVNLLKKDYDIENFSFPGSALYYSYYKFLKNYKEFDKIIFVFTLPGRISLKHPYDKKFMHLSYHHGIDLKKIMYPEDSKKYQIISDYMKYVQDLEKENILYNLMKEDIFSKRSDIISIYTEDLMTITAKENAYWGIDFEHQLTVNDIRHCHLIKENNFILYNKVKECLEKNIEFKLDIDDYVTCENQEDYLLPHKTHVAKVMKNWKI